MTRPRLPWAQCCSCCGHLHCATWRSQKQKYNIKEQACTRPSASAPPSHSTHRVYTESVRMQTRTVSVSRTSKQKQRQNDRTLFANVRLCQHTTLRLTKRRAPNERAWHDREQASRRRGQFRSLFGRIALHIRVEMYRDKWSRAGILSSSAPHVDFSCRHVHCLCVARDIFSDMHGCLNATVFTLESTPSTISSCRVRSYAYARALFTTCIPVSFLDDTLR